MLDGIVLFDVLQQLGRKFVFIASNKAAFLDRQQEFIIPLKRNVDLVAMYAQVGKKLTE
ncbi:MAG: hypothetical protein Q8O99_01815 [bacterium]|nr:hypothetical protein [bacterium]